MCYLHASRLVRKRRKTNEKNIYRGITKTESLKDQSVADLKRLELFQRQARTLHFGAQQLTWFEDGFDGQLKGTPVDRYRLLRTHVEMNLDCLRRVDVRRAHEVARRVGSDRNHREMKRPEALTDLFEVGIIVAGVAGEVTVTSS
jgi:hypothetical protein